MYNECRHILPSGRKCHSPALSGKPFCYYHTGLNRKPATPSGLPLRLPAFHIEDARGIQMALQQVLAAVESPYVPPRSIGLALYGLQLAIQLVDRAKAPEPAETVRTVCNLEGQPIHETDQIDNSTELLAPAATHCDPGTDCARCLHQDDCPNLPDPDDEDPAFEADEDESEDQEESEDNENDDSQDEADDDKEEDEADEAEDEKDEKESDSDDVDDADIDAAIRVLEKKSQSPKCSRISRTRQGPNPRAA